MYYGARSNAQLLFHSGFVNCSEDITSTEAEAMLSNDNSNLSTSHRFNRNRTDCALLRLALPPAVKDTGLDRIREMIAARFGFRAFTDQGVDHDGIEAAEAAASVIETSGGAGTKQTTNGKGEPKKLAAGTLRKAAEVVMIEVEVSPVDCVPIDLRNALLLCVADRDELTHLLRNMDTYTSREDTSAASTSESGNRGVLQDLLKLEEKHLVLAEELVKVQKRRRRKKQESIDPANGTDCTSLKLALCDEETLSLWLNALRSHIG